MLREYLFRRGGAAFALERLKQIPENLREFVTDDLGEPEQVKPQSVDMENVRREPPKRGAFGRK